MTIEFTITNRKGQEFKCLIDDCDKDLLECKWHIAKSSTGIPYVRRITPHIEGKQYTVALHRVVLERVLGHVLKKEEFVDHKDLNPLNNQRNNLRIATIAQNHTNCSAYKTNKLGVKGVVIARNRYRASITKHGKRTHLGYFDDIESAKEAYRIAAEMMFGEFARSE